MFETSSTQNISKKPLANAGVQTLSPFVYWAQTDKQVTLKVDLKDAKV